MVRLQRNDNEAISRANQQMHGIRITVMLAPLSALRNGYYCPSGRDPTVRIDIPPPSQHSEQFSSAALPPASTASYDRTSVSVIKQDCLLAALNMKERGLRPVVLIVASVCDDLDDPTNQRRPTYPIAEFGGIYTPDITIFRDSEDSGYVFRQVPFTVDFVAVAAYRYVT
ncbi:hypothetical protein BC936DRAFT_137814 [Jimgerdemannia flammicorona]|uniref:Uncharacterized protein n=1 Tax=Jimgerdemannia flammicorona TaxID=994334 RepID=A0A433CWL4_9FUNG|nr:hypothetical protein BC936DRAFT_137814 [Jimgerdemannia flammicorona]